MLQAVLMKRTPKDKLIQFAFALAERLLSVGHFIKPGIL